MARAVEAYGVAVAVIVLGSGLAMALFPGDPFLLAVIGDRLGTIWTGAIGILGLVVLAIPPAVGTAALPRAATVGTSTRNGAGHGRTLATAALLWPAWFLVLGLVLLVSGVADPGVKWNPVLTGIDLVITAIAGGVFARLLPARDLAPAPDVSAEAEPSA
jgi:hypothetical protein